MATYYEYIFGFASDIYDILEERYNYYNKTEFLQLVHYARNQHETLKRENERLQQENERLKLEITAINVHVVSTLERDVNHMRNTLDKVIKPKYSYKRTVEQLDV
jgi:cell division septum initiation protein DivIVA